MRRLVFLYFTELANRRVSGGIFGRVTQIGLSELDSRHYFIITRQDFLDDLQVVRSKEVGDKYQDNFQRL